LQSWLWGEEGKWIGKEKEQGVRSYIPFLGPSLLSSIFHVVQQATSFMIVSIKEKLSFAVP